VGHTVSPASTRMTLLITGATGDIGSRVVVNLLERGDHPRVFVRDAAKARARFGSRVEISIGDLTDSSTIRAALGGVDTLFLVNSGPELAARDRMAAQVATSVGVRRIVKLSSFDSTVGVGTGVWHTEGEKAIRETGIEFTFVQPAGFMSNALLWAPSIKSDDVVRSPTDQGKIAFIHPEDISAVAANALLNSQFSGRSLPITGPVALSYPEMVDRIGKALGRKLTFQPITEDAVRQRMTDSGDAPEVVDAHLSIYQAIREGRLAGVTDTVEHVLGRKPIAFERWINENL